MAQGDAAVNRSITITAGGAQTVQPAAGDVYRIERVGDMDNTGYNAGSGDVRPNFYDGTTSKLMSGSTGSTSEFAGGASDLPSATSGNLNPAAGSFVMDNSHYFQLDNTDACSSQDAGYEGIQIK